MQAGTVATEASVALIHTAPAAVAGTAPASVSPGLLSPTGLEAIAHMISAVFWPAIVIYAIIVFGSRITEFEGAGIKAKLQAKVRGEIAAAGDAAEEVLGDRKGPTPAEVVRSFKVQGLVGSDNLPFLRRQAENLAVEYERLRASMPPGDQRTRAMEKVVAKMRVIGRAAFALRHDLAASPSPGQRLQAIAILQVEPDVDYLPWLVERLGAEKPFVGYHAAVALMAAASMPDAARFGDALRAAADQSRAASFTLSVDTDREQVMDAFRAKVAALTPARGQQAHA